MKKNHFLPLFALLATFLPVLGQELTNPTTETGPLAPPDLTLNRASTIIHPDETKTVTLFDAQKRQSDVTYWNANGTWRAHIVYTLDESDRVKFGQFYSKIGKPTVRSLYRYDDSNRVIQESHYNLKGQLIRRMTYEYGLTDRVMKTVAYDGAGNLIGVYVPKRRSLKTRGN